MKMKQNKTKKTPVIWHANKDRKYTCSPELLQATQWQNPFTNTCTNRENTPSPRRRTSTSQKGWSLPISNVLSGWLKRSSKANGLAFSLQSLKPEWDENPLMGLLCPNISLTLDNFSCLAAQPESIQPSSELSWHCGFPTEAESQKSDLQAWADYISTAE